MNKRNLIVFALFAALLAIGVPVLALSADGSSSASPEDVPQSAQEGKELFADNCGSCHTLDRAGSDGVIGPNLDDALGTGDAAREGNVERVLTVIEEGRDGRMPAGILRGEAALEVAEFAAEYAGK